jgi:glycosyltransferase involved in cell wall biosynthesis
MMNLHINLSAIDFEKTLGVWHFAKKLLENLGRTEKVQLIGVTIPNKPLPPEYSVLFHRITSTPVPDTPDSVELLLHHFQQQLTTFPYAVICHDLHIFDVQWKYANPQTQLTALTNLVRSASAILTEFPRTFFDLPKVIEQTPNAIFLTISPTMHEELKLPTGYLQDVCDKHNICPDHKLILYPAQLQLHKNHINLIKAIKILLPRIQKLKVICCGSEFKESHTAMLNSAIDELGLRGIVSLPGYVPDMELEALYQRANLVISASLAEGGAYLAQEAILKNKNIAMSSIRPARMHLKVMGADIPLFDPLNVTDIASTLASALTTPQDHSPSRSIILRWKWEDLAKEYFSILNWISDGAMPGQMPIASNADLGLSLAGDNY